MLTENERQELRRSIRKGVAQAVEEFLMAEHHVQDVWCDPHHDDWEGPEVVEECKAALERFRRLWGGDDAD